jgi:hypothetical protein
MPIENVQPATARDIGDHCGAEFHEPPAPASLSALLEEFDRETAPAASPDGSPELHAAANGNDPTAVNEALARSQNAWLEAQKSGMATDLMKSRIDTLSNHFLGAIHQEQAQMRDQSDFSQVVNDADKCFARRALSWARTSPNAG